MLIFLLLSFLFILLLSVLWWIWNWICIVASIVLSDYRSDFSVSLGTPENSAIQMLSIIIVIVIISIIHDHHVHPSWSSPPPFMIIIHDHLHPSWSSPPPFMIIIHDHHLHPSWSSPPPFMIIIHGYHLHHSWSSPQDSGAKTYCVFSSFLVVAIHALWPPRAESSVKPWNYRA